MKRMLCWNCREVKTTNLFKKDKRNKSGICSICLSCSSQKERDRTEKLKENPCYLLLKKNCCKCGKEKKIGDFYKDLTKYFGVSSSCKECVNKYQLKYKYKNIDKIRSHDRSVRRVGCENLSDDYLKHVICSKSNLRFNMVPKFLIDMKRDQILIHRKLKEIKDEKCNGTTKRA